ncbi:MAG: DNA repair protein RecN [Bacteroidales bacterium]|nr:DNA repair protein RecN [Bacteroidales bacterium]
MDFQPKLTVITGETGSGKSIILGAIGLLQGKRADSKTIKQGAEKCVVEAYFNNIDSLNITPLLQEFDIEDSTPLILRREIMRNGKSRAFVNDTPVNLQQIKVIADKLIDIHSQHETLQLQEKQFQLHMVDTIAKLQDTLQTYQENLKQYRTLQKQLTESIEASNRAKAEQDFIQYQWQQLANAHLNDTEEQTTLEQQQNTMQHSEDVKSALTAAYTTLDGSNGVCSLLRNVASELKHIASFWPNAEQYLNRIEEGRIEFKDIAADLTSAAENMDFDSREKERVEERLNELYALQHKFNCNNLQELMQLQTSLQDKLNDIDNNSERIKAIEQAINKQHKVLCDLASQLSSKRKLQCDFIEQEITTRISKLGILHAQFKVDIKPLDDFTDNGRDEVSFLFSANQHHTPVEISNTASGGELSRLMLVIKSILAEHSHLPTVIFDEIDTGISGEVAAKMGVMMTQMSNHMQVMTITHLPQVASQPAFHLKVTKTIRTDDTITTISPLSKEARITEIAQMLSGESPSEAAIENAMELLGYTTK